MKRGATLCLLAALATPLALAGCPAEEMMMVDEDDFTLIFNTPYFEACGGCHAPDAPGFTAGTEETQNWSSRDAAFASLQGNASGLVGNFEGCNGVPLLGATPETSLLVASLDENVRANFSDANFPDCNADAISDMTLKVGMNIDPVDLELLTTWISNGAPNR